MAKKAEKRLALKALREERTREKAARQFINPNPGRSIVEGAAVDPRRVVPDTKLSPQRRLMCWDRKIEDVEGQWSWGAPRKCSQDHWNDIVYPFLTEYEKKSWGEIDTERTGKGKRRRKKHVHYPFDRLIDEAYERLIKLELDDFATSIFRFRLSGLQRLFGFRIPATAMFHMVWFDPEHRLYKQQPS